MTGGVTLARRIALFSAILIGVDFLDELASGIPGISSPDIQNEFQVSYGMAAGWLIAAFGLLAVVLEPPLFLLADRYPRRWFVCGGLAVLAVSCFIAASASSYWILFAALLLFGPASGCGVGLAQATLVDANPGDRERMLLRWTLSGSLGDLSAPLLLIGLAGLGLGWRTAFALSGVVATGLAVSLWRQPFPNLQDEDATHAPPRMRELLGDALRNKRLRPWIAGVILCDLLDELVIGFGALFLRDDLGLGLQARGLILASFTAGGAIGLAVSERLLQRFRPLPLLAASCAASSILYMLWLTASGPVVSGLLFFAVGLATSSHYPLASAQAYRALPDRSGSVNAVLSLAFALQLPIPLLLGWVADTFGLLPCLTMLIAQPVGLLAITLSQIATKGRQPKG